MLGRTTAATAFSSELTGETFEHTGTLTEARAALAASGRSGLWAVLP